MPHAGAVCGANAGRLFGSVLAQVSLPGIGAAGLMVFAM